MKPDVKPAAPPGPVPGHAVIFLLSLAGALLLLFHSSFAPQQILFSNDGPLGANHAKALDASSSLSGVWLDLNTVGINGGSYSPNITWALLWLLGPLYFAKFYVPLALLFLGGSAWFLFRRLHLGPLACVLGGLAAALNSLFFSIACWGVGPQAVCFGLSYLAVAAVSGQRARWPALRWVLAGFAVGMGVVEGSDVGAIFSLFVAAFVFYVGLMGEGGPVRRAARGVGQVALVAVCAAFLAANSLSVLIGTQIQGVAGMEQDTRTKQERWDWATQWSLPKRETLGLIVPGLFGYRMDTPGGGEYWGAAGRDPAWDLYFARGEQGPPPGGFLRYSGGGIYAGVLVVLIAVWAGAQALRRQGSVFSLPSRKLIWFWLGVMLIALLLAFGRYAPFYQFLYALPYFSTIRNPAKFMDVFNWALIVVFAYGVHGLGRRYLETPAPAAPSLSAHLRTWWAKVRGFDRRWTIGSLLAVALSLLGWLLYSSSRNSLEAYLQTVQFDAGAAKAIAAFSVQQVGWFVLFLALAVGLVALVVSGWLGGARAKWAGLLLGLLLVVDLARADRPWIIYWDWPQKYASTPNARNPIIDLLRAKPYEHRVAALPAWLPKAFRLPKQLAAAEQFFNGQLYTIEWMQHLFQYYDIQSLDIVQMSRMPADLKVFEGALQPRGDALYLTGRRWQLTNTRYLLGAAAFLDLLNQQFDPAQQRFKIVTRFDIAPKPGVSAPTRLEELTAAPATNGNYALYEFTGALPRAHLFARWQVNTNDAATLQELTSLSFDPEKSVLVASMLPAPSAATNAAVAAGTVEFASYAPKDIVLKAQAPEAAVLLLNDKYDPQWQVWVDGRPDRLLRCNYLMRGVYLQPGAHTVEFKFQPPAGALYVSLAAIALGVILCAVLVVAKPKTPAATEGAQRPPPR